MLKLLFVSSTTAAFEWQNNEIYTRTPYTVEIDNKVVFSGDTNVFSLFDLTPNTNYTLTLKPDGEKFQFSTKPESCCVSVKDFGAVGDGVSDDTNAIQYAINTVLENGRVTVPKGTYYVAPLVLKSNITLELCQGAVLLGNTDTSRYFAMPGEIDDAYTHEKVQIISWEGNPIKTHQPLVGGWRIQNVNIVGRGIIDGNAQNSTWWQNPKAEIGRPRLVFLNDCKNITLHGVTGQNAASWQMHPYYSQDIFFYDVKVNAPKDSPNTDAIDPEACDNVEIIGCVFSVGDDCIAIKSGKIYMGKKYKRPASRHTIRNCLMQFGHGAVVFGSEMAGGIKDITVNRCKFFSTDRGLRIKTRRGRGEDAVIDGILFENIQMDEVLTPIVINMWYNCCDPDRFSEYVWSREKLPVDDRTPYLGSFKFKDMVCTNCHVAAAYCDGLPEQKIGKIALENIHFAFSPKANPGLPAMRNFMETHCKTGLYMDNVKQLEIKNVTFEGVEGDHLTALNVDEII